MKRTQTKSALDKMLDEAEARHRCAVIENRALYAAACRLVQSKALVRPLPGMFMRVSTWGSMDKMPRVRWRYAHDTFKERHPGKALCSFSAALEYGLWVPARRLGTVHIAVASRTNARSSTYVHSHYCPQDEVVERDGASVTMLMRTVLDCSLEGSIPEGLAIADSALRYCGLDLDEYRDYVEQHASGRPGAGKARLVARYADGRAENGGESIARGRILELGYRAPTDLQVEFLDEVDGSSTIRTDMYYLLDDGSEVIVELDGMGKYGSSASETKAALVAERQRESHLTANGIPVMRILFARVYDDAYLRNLLDAYKIPRCGDSQLVQNAFPHS